MSLKGCVDTRRLSDGAYIDSVELIPSIPLVDAGFRGAEFATEPLKNAVRASGAIME